MRAILTFHSVDDSGEVLSYSPRLFQYLLASLERQRIPVLTLDALLNDDVQRGVALTFDDGMKSVHSDALPLLKQYDASAHVYVATDLIGIDSLWPPEDGVGRYQMMNLDDLADLHEAGIALDAHTASHPDVRDLSADELSEQCQRSDEFIYQITGKYPSHFAYPFGYHNRQARELVAKRYVTAVTTELAMLDENVDRAAIPRIDSYFLRSTWMIDNLESAAAKYWLQLRSSIRTLAGRQCAAKTN